MDRVTIYTTSACPDCRYAKAFLRYGGVSYRERNIEEDEAAEKIVLKVNAGLRKVPTLEVGGRYFACSPFDPDQLAEELNISLNP